MISREIVEKRFRQLVFVTKLKTPNSELSFSSGLWFEEEGYKLEFWRDARKHLQLEEWNQKTDREIVSLATQPFGVLIDGSYHRQNLVSDNNYSKLFELFLERQSESSDALKEIFFGADEKIAFEKMAKLLSRKSLNDPLSVISLFFFLKDKERFVTARKQGTGERISKLGISAACVQNCTWNGYQQYLEIIRDIKNYLPENLHASFLDAQSFLWMLWMVDNDTPEYDLKQINDCSYVDDLVNHKGTPLSVNQWEELIREGFINDEDIRFLAKFYAYPEHAVSCSELGRNEGKYHTSYNKRAKDIGSKVSRRFELPSMLYEDGVTDLYFPVEFLWRKDQTGDIVWCVRPELARAMENVCPDVLGAGIDEYQKAEQEEAQKISDDEVHARAKAAGNYRPVQYTSQTVQYRRNEYVATDAKRRAKGKCQLCGGMPFYDKNNNTYLEVHHIVWLSKGGADSLENVVALCPNCHRKMHVNPGDDDIDKLKKTALNFMTNDAKSMG